MIKKLLRGMLYADWGRIGDSAAERKVKPARYDLYEAEAALDYFGGSRGVLSLGKFKNGGWAYSQDLLISGVVVGDFGCGLDCPGSFIPNEIGEAIMPEIEQLLCEVIEARNDAKKEQAQAVKEAVLRSLREASQE